MQGFPFQIKPQVPVPGRACTDPCIGWRRDTRPVWHSGKRKHKGNFRHIDPVLSTAWSQVFNRASYDSTQVMLALVQSKKTASTPAFCQHLGMLTQGPMDRLFCSIQAKAAPNRKSPVFYCPRQDDCKSFIASGMIPDDLGNVLYRVCGVTFSPGCQVQ